MDKIKCGVFFSGMILLIGVIISLIGQMFASPIKTLSLGIGWVLFILSFLAVEDIYDRFGVEHENKKYTDNR